MDRYAHVVDHADDVFDLLGIRYLIRQVIVNFAKSQIALLFSFSYELLQSRFLLRCIDFFSHISSIIQKPDLEPSLSKQSSLDENRPSIRSAGILIWGVTLMFCFSRFLGGERLYLPHLHQATTSY